MRNSRETGPKLVAMSRSVALNSALDAAEVVRLQFAHASVSIFTTLQAGGRPAVGKIARTASGRYRRTPSGCRS